jgi:hypothetical protein
MKLSSKAFLLNLEEKISIGELTAVLVCQVNGTKEQFDTDFIDLGEVTYMGILIDGYDNWRKFKDFHLGMGINFSKLIDEKFNEIFTKEVVKQFVDKVKF